MLIVEWVLGGKELPECHCLTHWGRTVSLRVSYIFVNQVIFTKFYFLGLFSLFSHPSFSDIWFE